MVHSNSRALHARLARRKSCQLRVDCESTVDLTQFGVLPSKKHRTTLKEARWFEAGVKSLAIGKLDDLAIS